MFVAAITAARGDLVLPAVSRVEGNDWIYSGPGGFLKLPLPASNGRVVVIGAGKASAAMASGLERVLGDRIDHGFVIVKRGGALPLRRIRCVEGGHPIPDATSAAATRELLSVVDAIRPQDTVFFLLSGGASSLLCLPVDALSFSDKTSVNQVLVNSGASIAEINTVRKHLSLVKGGRLRERCAAGSFCTLAISDVIGDDPAIIGSGPSVPDETTPRDALAVIDAYGLRESVPKAVIEHLTRGERRPSSRTGSTYRVVCSNRVALEAAAAYAQSQGWAVQLVTDRMSGSTHEAAKNLVRTLREQAKPTVVLAGGETTLAVTGAGRGGRNQEFAVVAAMELQGVDNITLLAAGSDGTDGPTDAAGAYADGSFVSRARAANRDIDANLRSNDTYSLLDATGDLYRTGPTGTNVMDLVFAVVG